MTEKLSEIKGAGAFPILLDEAAIARTRALLAKDGRDGAFLRVGVKGGGCSGFEYVLKLDVKPREGDLLAAFDGVPVACDPKSARFLAGSTLVYTGNLIGGGFKIENPNAARSCGCGASFTPKRA
ncbi:MAG: iron-sulfur cluster assembly accessory protein [Fimbriimonas ginsengisoli]|uniref:Iron-sulfur cluster assembly accessory protein n=1 Tax=Fimbriimonas ginsengisoli TaxID=1005039 RepID=A0A931PW67_FIMGI|nr:iron-sulfur cluster assembly accessory protein [Fimbriimonas ginsengisoli]